MDDDDIVLSDTASVWKVRVGDDDDEWHRSMHQREVSTQTETNLFTDDVELIFIKLQRLETLLMESLTPWWRRWRLW